MKAAPLTRQEDEHKEAVVAAAPLLLPVSVSPSAAPPSPHRGASLTPPPCAAIALRGGRLPRSARGALRAGGAGGGSDEASREGAVENGRGEERGRVAAQAAAAVAGGVEGAAATRSRRRGRCGAASPLPLCRGADSLVAVSFPQAAWA